MNVADLLGLPGLDFELPRVEAALAGLTQVADPFLGEVATHLLGAGGKRLRPALLLAAAGSADREITDEVIQGAVAVELVHLASLYHDDVIDEASTRRAVASVNARFGNLVAVVAGDFLLARAAVIAASLGTEVSSLLASTLARMCQGQLAEVRASYDVSRSEDSYLQAIAGKTAALMSCACGIGALTAGLAETELSALSIFGECLGMVFQIRDDVLDIVASDDELGKQGGQDLAQGVYTLPVLFALAEADAAPQLVPLLGRPLDLAERDEACSVVATSGAITAATRVARSWADRAATAAAALGPSEVTEALRALPHALLDTIPVATV